MQERTWMAVTFQGKAAEYYYYESESACWASRKIGDICPIPKRVPRGLTNKQVQELLDIPSTQNSDTAGNRPELISEQASRKPSKDVTPTPI